MAESQKNAAVFYYLFIGFEGWFFREMSVNAVNKFECMTILVRMGVLVQL